MIAVASGIALAASGPSVGVLPANAAEGAGQLARTGEIQAVRVGAAPAPEGRVPTTAAAPTPTAAS